MKYTLTCWLLFLISSVAAQQSHHVVCSGQVMKRVTIQGSIYETPYSDLRVLLINTSAGGIRYDRNICSEDFQRDHGGSIKTFTTDSKGNYNFSYPYRVNERYSLIICSGSNVVQVTIPISENRNIRVPTQYF